MIYSVFELWIDMRMDCRNDGKAMCSRVLTAIRLKLMGSPDPKIIVLVACHNK